MSSKPKMPKASPAATAAQQAQMQILQDMRTQIAQQVGTQNLLMPKLFAALGLNPTMSNGQITGFKTGLDGPLGSTKMAVLQKALENEQMALNGEIPIDSQLTQELDRQQGVLENKLRATFGADYAGTTAGQAALADFQQRRSNIVASNARQDIGVFANAATQNESDIERAIAEAMGLPTQVAQTESALGPVAANYGSIFQTDAQLRQAKLNADVQASNGMWSGIGQLVGTGVGLALAPATGGMSLFAAGAAGAGGAMSPASFASTVTPSAAYLPKW